MMLAVATTLTTVLLPGAFAIPDAAAAAATHRAMQSGEDSSLPAGFKMPAGFNPASGPATALPELAGFAAEVAAATTVDANGDHHLWFRTTDPALGWCGEIDAAPFMPAEIFQPTHFLSLIAYADVTLNLYTNPNPRATPLALGKCSGINYNKYNGQLTGVSWFGGNGTPNGGGGSLMGNVCAVQCGCSFGGIGPGALPACIDLPDYPSAGRFCSLCGPSTACPGCGAGEPGTRPGLTGGLITGANPIHLFTEGPAECEPRGSDCCPAWLPNHPVPFTVPPSGVCFPGGN